MRYFVEFAYEGTPYHGWQRQPNALGVQEVMEEGFSLLCGTPIALTAAGRTDTGVHARHMVAHFDIEDSLETADLSHRLNSFLPKDISIKRIYPVTNEAHARFDAIERTYEYVVVQQKDPFHQHSAHFVHQVLDVENMNRAAGLLLGTADFKCFSRSNTDVKTYVCDIREARWVWEGDRLVFRIVADRFLRNMVRAIVGTLLQVGLGKWSAEDVKTIINSRKRSEAGPSVPAKGLYLVDISYPEKLLKIHGSGDR
ncbi:MAG: tRNA pseudouridine(38-40) synthase TruA [Flavobacteriaceae bacterium]|nr:tRNA pseudouridine(38-40) synthase TruA [Flavobacteriaceae bacterium]MDH3796418.1 tRNA pseudouridine(38-40) synthase TruA [Flavobacteriaceae bacterium]